MFSNNPVIVKIMKKIITATIFLFVVITSYCQNPRPQDTEDWSRKPEVVTPGKGTQPPSDAIILYGGPEDMSKWVHERQGEAKWKAEEILTVVPRTGGIKTVQSFGDVQLHVEWRAPEEVVGEGQGRGNSGIFLMGKYEIQILDSYRNDTYADGQAAALYGQYPPLVNACLPPGEWQTYDILLVGRRVTVSLNGTEVVSNRVIPGITGGALNSDEGSSGPLMLQGDHGPIEFRNVVITPGR